MKPAVRVSQDTRTIPRCSWDHLCMKPTVWVSQDSQDTQTILGCSWDHVCIDPHCLSIPGFPGYSDYPRMFLGLPEQGPWVCIPGFPGYYDNPRMFLGPCMYRTCCLSIPGFPGYLDNPRMFLGPSVHEARCLSTPGFPGYSDNPRMFLGPSVHEAHCLSTPCRMFLGARTPLSEYPRIPRILRRS